MINDRFSTNNRANRIKFLLLNIIVPAGVLGFIIWHTILWETNGTHNQMLTWMGSPKTYLVVLYNMALMLITGTLLGILMGRITDLIGHHSRKK